MVGVKDKALYPDAPTIAEGPATAEEYDPILPAPLEGKVVSDTTMLPLGSFILYLTSLDIIVVVFLLTSLGIR